MNKKLQIAIATVIIFLLLIGGVVYALFYDSQKPANKKLPVAMISYLVSSEDLLKYLLSHRRITIEQ